MFWPFSSSLGITISKREVQIREIPNLAKNQRDVGHPSSWQGGFLKSGSHTPSEAARA
jgi:hypothetical protein